MMMPACVSKSGGGNAQPLFDAFALSDIHHDTGHAQGIAFGIALNHLPRSITQSNAPDFVTNAVSTVKMACSHRDARQVLFVHTEGHWGKRFVSRSNVRLDFLQWIAAYIRPAFIETAIPRLNVPIPCDNSEPSKLQ